MKKRYFIICGFMLALYFPQTILGQDKTLGNFVKGYYLHGVPYEEARAIGSGKVLQLKDFLYDPAYKDYLENIIITLGFSGDPEATNVILDFIESRTGEISMLTFSAILSGFQALGALAANGDDLALANLKAYASTNNYEAKGLQFSCAGFSTLNLSSAIYKMSIQGLGISGRKEAINYLEELKDLQLRGALTSDFQDDISQAIELNVSVQNKGVKSIFPTTK